MVIYTLINPYISGTIKHSYDAENEDAGAEKIWKSFSKYFNNDVPKFYITIKQKGGSLFHYKITESKYNNDDVNYKMKKINVPTNIEQNLLKMIKKLKYISQSEIIAGGHRKHRYDDDSSSSSDEEEYDVKMFKKMMKRIHIQQSLKFSPMSHIWYDPILYNDQDIFIPTFKINDYPTTYIQLHNEPKISSSTQTEECIGGICLKK